MSEKKICKMNDEEMKKVAGGWITEAPACEDASSGYDASADFTTDYKGQNTIQLTCPECGGDMGSVPETSNSGITFVGVCPHCKKNVSVTV